MLLRRDPATVAQAVAAANLMYRALRNMGCTCTHNVPYAGCKVEQKVVARCRRCVALAAWEDIEQEDADHEPNPSLEPADRPVPLT